MAKNDYHVLACRVLAYLYAYLKAGSEVSAEYLTDIFCKAGAGEDYQDYVLRQLFQSGYLEDVQTVDLPGKAFPGVKPARGLMITPGGSNICRTTAQSEGRGHFSKPSGKACRGFKNNCMANRENRLKGRFFHAVFQAARR